MGADVKQNVAELVGEGLALHVLVVDGLADGLLREPGEPDGAGVIQLMRGVDKLGD